MPPAAKTTPFTTFRMTGSGPNRQFWFAIGPGSPEGLQATQCHLSSHSAFCTRRWRYASGSSFPSADYLREDIHGDYGLPWYISMLAFKITILGIIEDQLNQSNPNVIIWHARMGTTPTSFAALSRRSFSRRVRLRRRVLSLPKESRYGRGCAASGFTGHQIGQATVCPTGRSVQDMALCLDSRRLDDLAEAASSLSGYRVCHDNHRRRPSQSRYAYPYSNAYRCPSQTLALATSRLRLFRSTPSSAALTMLLAFA
ncbi:hypothetical protein N7524_002277 [Penicillium chrysogenum]|nr:hypothetical protein N7524_002277 [Penicillium chrysogenum]